MSICMLWSAEHGCARCRDRRGCDDLGLSPFDNATALEMNALVDAGDLPESCRREVHAVGRAVGFAGTEGGGCRITLELERDDGVWYEIEEGDLLKVVMAGKKRPPASGRDER